jgi:hypothetical protein
MVKNKIKFVLIVWPRGMAYDSPIFISPYEPCHIFLPISLIYARLYIVLGFVFLKGKLY